MTERTMDLVGEGRIVQQLAQRSLACLSFFTDVFEIGSDCQQIAVAGL
jgi:hypothetical protein